ncbi:OLC1v1013485C1 [Oldenlandia corymbosa var. corymbosa]|uniref:OLC1v1013485C1 n=1 Tax=Oldenlandia corymbosa var. corymbosa TaxID=529605 RepID=A0AAV1DYM8_OLDCO|nr:OLC1v1013485C1 [Oldenlandia corymbosa var. corymbosa]
MASTLIDCIHSALHEVDMLIHRTPLHLGNSLIRYKQLKIRLGNLKMVVSSATKLDFNFSPSYLEKTEVIVRKIGSYVPNLEREGKFFFLTFFYKVNEDIKSLHTLTKELYPALLDARRQSSCLTIDKVLDFISLSLENVKSFQDSARIPVDLHDAIKALEEQMTFLKSLVVFVVQTNIEPNNDLLAHVGAVVIEAAFLRFDDGFCQETYGVLGLEKRVAQKMVLEISTLIQKMEPVHPHVGKIYTEALNSSKLTARLLLSPADRGTESDAESLVATQNLLSSLVSILYRKLTQSGRVVDPNRDQLRQLYEGLRSLRKSVTKQLPNKLDQKNIQGDIVSVVCDVAVFICSFQQSHDQEAGLICIVQQSSETIKKILSNLGVGEKDAQVPLCNSRSTTLLAFFDFLIEKLMELTSNNVELTAIQQELDSLRSLLGDIVEQPNVQGELQDLKGRILEVAYRVEDLIDHSLLVGSPPNSLSELSFSIKKDISNIMSEITFTKKPEIQGKKSTASQSQLVKSTSPSMSTKEIVGFHDEATSIINRLKRGSKNLRNGVLLDLLKQVDPGKYSKVTSEANADDVAEQLRRSLKGKRYLIVLDDIWEAKAWQQLQASFPDDSKGSRIIFTSRRHDVAPPEMLDEENHFELRLLNENQSLYLLQSQLFGKNDWPTELDDLRMKIVEMCNGLPLTIILVAGILRSMEPNDWKRVIDSVNRGSLAERCKDTLELSYRHLPEHLKPCLLYFAAFREDQQVLVKRLLALWMAEGFIRKVETKRLSDVAGEYLNDLIGRSLLMVSKVTSTGRVKRCRVHDLLHEFCSQKTKEEQFFHFLEGGYDELVLDLEQIHLDGGIPCEIGELVGLAYLAIGGSVREIPQSIGKLSNLKTFIIIGDLGEDPFLPESFWNLRKLNHLSFALSDGRLYFVMGLRLPCENLENSSDLGELERISGVGIPCDRVERVLNKFPNLRDLKFQLCGLDNHDGDPVVQAVVVPDILTQLESLFVYKDPNVKSKVEFGLPAKLMKLTLGSFELTGRFLSGISKLPHLEYLNLYGTDFEGNTWRMEEEEGQFSKLRILKLRSCFLRSWSGGDDGEDQFGCLEKLVLSDCRSLEEMPACFQSIQTLQLIKSTDCTPTVTDLVKKIEKVQTDYGNTNLKIIVSNEVSWRN